MSDPSDPVEDQRLAGIVESGIDALQATTLDKLPIGVYRSTPDGRIVDANPALVALLGYPDSASLLSTSAGDLYADPAERERILAQADREGALRGVETQVRRRDGGTIWVRLNTFLARDARGLPLFYVGTIEDVTERRLAEESLWDSEARQKLLLDQLPAMLWTTDRELRITLAQGTGLVALNLLPNQLTGTTLYEYFQTDDADFPPLAAHRRALGGEEVSYETEWAGRAYESHVRPLAGADGRVAGTLGIALDVTDRQRLKDAEKETNRRQRCMVETTLAASTAASLEEALQAFTDGARVIFGARHVAIEAGAAAEGQMLAVTTLVGRGRISPRHEGLSGGARQIHPGRRAAARPARPHGLDRRGPQAGRGRAVPAGAARPRHPRLRPGRRHRHGLRGPHHGLERTRATDLRMDARRGGGNRRGGADHAAAVSRGPPPGPPPLPGHRGRGDPGASRRARGAAEGRVRVPGRADPERAPRGRSLVVQRLRRGHQRAPARGRCPAGRRRALPGPLRTRAGGPRTGGSPARGDGGARLHPRPQARSSRSSSGSCGASCPTTAPPSRSSGATSWR